MGFEIENKTAVFEEAVGRALYHDFDSFTDMAWPRLQIEDVDRRLSTDLEAQILRFKMSAQVLADMDGYPAIDLGDDVVAPVDAVADLMDEHADGDMFNSQTLYDGVRAYADVDRLNDEALFDGHERGGLSYFLMPVKEAFERVRIGIAEAWSARAVVDREDGYTGFVENTLRMDQVPGLAVTVHSQAVGAQVLYSPAYLFRKNQRFGGQLSTPVTSFIGPSKYLFGVNSGSGPKFESTIFDIPPNYDIHLREV